MNKRWRIKETYTYTGWTYVDAPNIEEAERLLNNGSGEFDESLAVIEWRSCSGEIEEVP